MKKILLTLSLLMTFAMGATADDVKTPYAVWVNNSYLFFTMRTEAITVGGTFVAENGNEYTVSGVWSGDQVVNSPQYSTPAWNSSTTRNSIRSVVFESSFQDARPKSLYEWFYNCKYLSSVSGIENLNTSECLSMGYMFYYCQYLSSIDLSQLDTHNVEDMNNMFYNCIYLTSVGDLSGWDTSSLKYAQSMFNNCYRLTSVGDLSGWNTDNLAQVSYMFYACRALGTVDLSGWNTSNVESFEGMFFDCRVLTSVGDLSGWQLDKATSTTDMFKQCYKLETLDVSTWDVSNVRTMDGMFRQCFALQALDVSNWDVSNVTNFNSTFCGLSKVTTLDLSRWRTARATAMFGMFMDSSSLTSLDLSGFYTSNVTNMNDMFYRCSALESITVSNLWSVANAASTATEMFGGCTSIVGQDGTTYDSNAVGASKAHWGEGGYLRHGTDVALGTQPYVIYNASSTTLYMLQSDETLTANEEFTPAGADAPIAINNIWYGKDVCASADNGGESNGEFNLPWTSSLQSKATKVVFEPSFASVRPISTKSWFNYFSRLTNVEGIANLNMSEVVTTESMFESCSVLQEIPDIEHLDMSHVADASYMFAWCYQLSSLDVSTWNVSQLENAKNLFNSCESLESIDVSGWNTARLKNADSMFAWCSKLNSLDVSTWDVSSLRSAYAMFCGLSWENVDLSGWSTSSLENCSSMFEYSSNLATVNISEWNTDGVVSISSMFSGCPLLTTITGIDDFNTANVEFMSYAFSGCSALQSLDLSRWNTSKVWEFQSMFYGCSSLRELNVNNFDVTGVNGEPNRYRYDLGSMFQNCSSLTTLDLSNWDTSQVEFMADMFSGCTNLEAIYVGEGWTTDKVLVGTYYYQTNGMFEGCTAIIGEDGTTYDAADYTIARAHYNEGGYLRRHHTDYTITIPTSGIGTFSAAENVTLAEGLTAYTCTNYDEAKGVITAQGIDGDIIPAHTGVLVKGEAGETYTLYATADESVSSADNALVAVTVPTHVAQTDGDNTNFMLQGGKFIKIADADTSSKMHANKAYLSLPSSVLSSDAGAAGIMLEWTESTGITEISSISSKDDAIYDLQGRRVGTPQKDHLYIVNGKKTIIK